jgi:SAM-dependent methyltransferase
MGVPESVRQLKSMRRDWDRRARQNAHYYVATGKRDWSVDDFYQSGETDVGHYVTSDMDNVCQGQDPKEMRVLEIGCGAGRITRALARVFGEVYAVDISGVMVRRARQALSGYPNAHILQNNGRDLSVVRPGLWRRILGHHLKFDFAFSIIVFQHIPSREIVESYVRDTCRLLRPGALFKFQVQGCSSVEVSSSNSWMGVPYTRAEAAEMAERCGFEMRYDEGAGEQYYWLWFFKKPG